MTNDDFYLVKLKGAHLSDSIIATRLKISVSEVTRRWKLIQEELQAAESNGHTALCNQYTTLCHQYQLLGESLKIISMAISNTMPSSEIRALIKEDPEETLENLTRSCIILRPFIPINPIESLKESTQRIQQGN